MNKKRGLSITALVIGIFSVVVSCFGGGFFGIVSIVVGIIAIKKEHKNAMSITGIILSGVAIFVSFLMGIILIIAIMSSGKTYTSAEVVPDISGGNTQNNVSNNIEIVHSDTENNTQENIPQVIGGNGLEGELVIGNTVKFGAYEQDNNVSNGCEAIEWIVVDIEDNKALLLTKYIIDNKPFNESDIEDVTWENSTIRKWLNDDLYKTAFSESEKSLICPVINQTDCILMNGIYYIETEDKVFLFSNDDLKEYYDYEKYNYTSMNDINDTYTYGEAVAGIGTEYACAQGLDVVLHDGYSSWWLRSDAANTEYDYTKIVDHEGYVRDHGYDSNNSDGIRPAIWITIEPDGSETNGMDTDSDIRVEAVLWSENDGTLYSAIKEWYVQAIMYKDLMEQYTVLIGENYIIQRFDSAVEIRIYKDNMIQSFCYHSYYSEAEKTEIFSNIEALWSSYDGGKLMAYGTIEKENGTLGDMLIYDVSTYNVDSSDISMQEDVQYLLSNGWSTYYE